MILSFPPLYMSFSFLQGLPTTPPINWHDQSFTCSTPTQARTHTNARKNSLPVRLIQPVVHCCLLPWERKPPNLGGDERATLCPAWLAPVAPGRRLLWPFNKHPRHMQAFWRHLRKAVTEQTLSGSGYRAQDLVCLLGVTLKLMRLQYLPVTGRSS